MKITKWENMDVVVHDNKKYILFFGYKCPFSNTYRSIITYNNEYFNCVEQIFAYEKARLFEPSVAQDIKNCTYGAQAKKLGSYVKNFDPKIWDNHRELVMKEALRAKFDSNTRLKTLLEFTQDAELIEVSPYDKFWGAGVDRTKMIELIEQDKTYPGRNTLGNALMSLREEYKLEERMQKHGTINTTR